LPNASLNEWCKRNIPGYAEKVSLSPTIVLTKEQHNITRSIYGKWKYERFGFEGKVDWNQISPSDIIKLAEDMFKAIKIPQNKKAEYYKLFIDFILKTLD
jgi:hypothetical protein